MKNVENFNAASIPDDTPKGYVLQLILKYPSEINNVYKDVPLAREHHIPLGSKLPKLLGTLHNKKTILHCLNLKPPLELKYSCSRFPNFCDKCNKNQITTAS